MSQKREREREREIEGAQDGWVEGLSAQANGRLSSMPGGNEWAGW